MLLLGYRHLFYTVDVLKLYLNNTSHNSVTYDLLNYYYFLVFIMVITLFCSSLLTFKGQ